MNISLNNILEFDMYNIIDYDVEIKFKNDLRNLFEDARFH